MSKKEKKEGTPFVLDTQLATITSYHEKLERNIEKSHEDLQVLIFEKSEEARVKTDFLKKEVKSVAIDVREVLDYIRKERERKEAFKKKVRSIAWVLKAGSVPVTIYFAVQGLLYLL